MTDIIDTTAEIIDENINDSSKEERVIICKNIIPFNSSIIESKTENGPTVAVISYICKDDRDELFVINRAYNINGEEQKLAFECLPFAEFDTDYISRKIEVKWLNSSLPHYTTNFQFYMDENNNSIYTYAIKSSDRKKYKINISNEIFMSILYIDKHPIVDDDNDHDLSLAVLNGAKTFNKDSEFYIVNRADVIAIADATYREAPETFIDKIKAKFAKEELVSTNVAVKLQLFNYAKPDESLQLLAPFDVGVVFDDAKFKGKTIDNLEENYFEDRDQYISNLIVMDAKIYGIDKSYMIIRAINKNKESKIFLIDNVVKEQINNKINEY